MKEMNKINKLIGVVTMFGVALITFYAFQTLHMFSLWLLRSNLILTGFYLLLLILIGIQIVRNYTSKIATSTEIILTRIIIYRIFIGLGLGIILLFIQGFVFSFL